MLGVRIDTVKSWCVGRNRTPPGVIEELRALYRRIEVAADEALGVFAREGGGVDVIEIGVAATDAEAQALGCPCVGAHEALIGLIAARARVPVRVVPRGSTPATAAATIV